MKAIVIREFGPPDVMRLEEVATPEPGPGEVLIRVHAVSVNRTLDLVARAGKLLAHSRGRYVRLNFVVS